MPHLKELLSYMLALLPGFVQGSLVVEGGRFRCSLWQVFEQSQPAKMLHTLKTIEDKTNLVRMKVKIKPWSYQPSKNCGNGHLKKVQCWFTRLDWEVKSCVGALLVKGSGEARTWNNDATGEIFSFSTVSLLMCVCVPRCRGAILKYTEMLTDWF